MNEKNISINMYLKIVRELDRLLSRDSMFFIDLAAINQLNSGRTKTRAAPDAFFKKSGFSKLRAADRRND